MEEVGGGGEVGEDEEENEMRGRQGGFYSFRKTMDDIISTWERKKQIEKENEMKYRFGGVFKERDEEEIVVKQVFLQLLQEDDNTILRFVEEDGYDPGGRILAFGDLGNGRISKRRIGAVSFDLCKSLGWEQDKHGAVIFD